MNPRRHIVLLGSLVLLLAGGSAAAAGNFPDRPLRIVVPYAPGGSSDIGARIIAQKLSERLKQPVVVDNRPGAGGTVGTDHVAKSAPDGYTLLLSDIGVYSVAPALYPKLPYKPADLAPLIDVSSAALLLVTASGSRLRSFQDVLSLEQQKPGTVNAASAGSGTLTHLLVALLNETAKTRLQHIPYKGGGAALIDVLGGQIDMMFIGTPPAMPHINDKRLRVLAVTSGKRLASMPDVPTLAESGVNGFEVTSNDVIFAPAGTPPAVMATLNREIAEVLKLPDVRKRWAELGAEPGRGNSPEQTKANIDRAAMVWTRLIREANIKLD